MSEHVAVIIGSLCRESIARRIAQNAIGYFPEGYTSQIVEIRDLPLYDFDYDDPASGG